MNKNLIPLALLLAVPACALADDGWSGTGELGFAATRGNAKSENLNAKLEFRKEDETWKDHFYLTALRSKGESTVSTVVDGEAVSVKNYDLTANRYEGGASVGYKLDERSYVVGALRYENDDFSPFEYQAVASIGYGYTLLKNQHNELSFEAGPGYKRYQPVDVYGPAMSQKQLAEVRPQGRAVVRAYTPTLEENGWDPGCSVVEVVTDDMPFLVDSVTMELDRHDIGIRLVVHPQMRVMRDLTGRMLGRDQEDVTGQMTVESWMHVEIDKQADPEVLKQLEADLQRRQT